MKRQDETKRAPSFSKMNHISWQKRDSSTCHSGEIKSHEDVWADGMNIIYRERLWMVRNGQGLLAGDTKPLLCNQLGVKSPRTKAHKGRGLVAGWESGNTAVSRACTSQLNMGSPRICGSPGPCFRQAPGQWGPSADPLLLQSFSEFPFEAKS